MIVRLGLLIAASIAAYVVRQRKSGRSSYREEEEPSENEESKPEQHPDGEKEEKTFLDLEISTEEFYVEEEEEKVKVKRVNNIADFCSRTLRLVNEEEEEAFAGYEEFFSGEIDFPLPIDEFEVNTDPQHASNMANNEAELQRLRYLVKELEEREVKLEGELLEYYGLKEQESDVSELQKQLKIKSLEIDMLNITINTLHAERKKLQEEIMSGMSAKKELEATRNKLKELQRQVQLEASQTKGQLTMLMQQVTALHQKEEESVKLDAEIQNKCKAMKELEVKVLELRRMNKELQHEKRELTMKLDAAESRAAALSNMTEMLKAHEFTLPSMLQNEMVIKAREDVINLRHANEDLVKQVEGLQMNRFSEVEELVYLRWVNACLRYELRNYQTGKLSARDLSKSLSPRSQEKAKRLMLEYAGSERGQGDTDLESISSQPSSPGSDDFDNASVDSSSSKFSTFSKKTSLVQKLKRWGRAKDELSAMLSPSRSFGGNSSMRSSNSAKSPAMRGPLEALMLRNAGDSMAITTFGKREDEPLESLHGSSSDPLNSVTASFQLMSKSVEGVAEDKYPAYKDRHKLALEREKAIKEKADQARAGRFGYGQSFESKVKFGIATPVVLPPKLAQLKKVSGGTNMGSEGTNTSGGVTEITDPSKDSGTETPVVSKMKLAHTEKRAPRVPQPPPRSLAGTSATDAKITSTGNGIPPPPPPPLTPGAPPPPPRPPPPPGSVLKGSPGGKVHRAPELVELYQSLMKRESKNTTALPSSGSSTADARSNMIGEIENRSTFLLAVKADVESQGDFVNSLAVEVRAASFTRIEDLLLFVNWLDEELSFLVDERAVLKHFDWPEGKADALREAAFEYQDLMKLESQVSAFADDPKLPCEVSLKKMYSLLEKMEQSVYALLRTRDMAISRYKEFGFPVDWLNDSGVVGKIKLASVQLARKYMKRVSTELDALCGTEKEPNREFLLLQGVRFAFRVHQFAGGFDAESMQAFEELRSRVNSGTTGSDKNES